ncbi:MAG: biotin--[acetyl-CoA-carboxylase] ligase [Alphaproteobacteria bacterium]|nr:biotin--[acetyl-CoA-carboxylase] ligase [Alphaproteobacteria bacterium]
MANYKVISFDKIPSTQTYAHDMIANGRGADHIAVLADAQSAGRGRYKRTWISHHGNLYVSFILSCEERDARLSYAVGVAIAETLIAFGVTPTIKWPNDILIDNKKVSGTLIEYSGRFVVIGIGINIKTNPTVNADYKTTKLDNYINVTRDDLLNKLMRNLDKWRNADFCDVRTRWTELAAGLNRNVKYRGETVELIGINENGALVLRNGTHYMLVYGDEITMDTIIS